MEIYFLDTSALFKRYVTEEGSDVVSALFLQETGLVISSITISEVVSNLRRLVDVSGLIDEEQYRGLKAVFFADIADGRLEVVELTTAVIIQSSEIISKAYMKPIDAIQLAVALSVRNENLTFVCSDKALCKRASIEGLTVLNPAEESQQDVGEEC